MKCAKYFPKCYSRQFYRQNTYKFGTVTTKEPQFLHVERRKVLPMFNLALKCENIWTVEEMVQAFFNSCPILFYLWLQSRRYVVDTALGAPQRRYGPYSDDKNL